MVSFSTLGPSGPKYPIVGSYLTFWLVLYSEESKTNNLRYRNLHRTPIWQRCDHYRARLQTRVQRCNLKIWGFENLEMLLREQSGLLEVSYRNLHCTPILATMRSGKLSFSL